MIILDESEAYESWLYDIRLIMHTKLSFAGILDLPLPIF